MSKPSAKLVKGGEFVDPDPPTVTYREHLHKETERAPASDIPIRPAPTIHFNEDHSPLRGGVWEEPMPDRSVQHEHHGLIAQEEYVQAHSAVHPKKVGPPPKTPLIEIVPLQSTSRAEFTHKSAAADPSPRAWGFNQESQPPPDSSYPLSSTLRSSYPAHAPEEYASHVAPVPSPRKR